jgi:5-methylthioadenosine/S-adenosylhomocysteine deaminase
MALILHGKLVLPMTPDNRLIEDGAVLVADDGTIGAVDTAAKILADHVGIAVKRLDHALLMPGLVNAHAHSGLLRGTAEGLPVWDWLEQFIDPMHRVLTPREAEIASWLCYAEALLSGTTTIVDMWRYMDGSARAAAGLGIRTVLVPYVGEHPDHDYFETLDGNEALIEAGHGKADGRINVWVGLEHMFYATPEAWDRAVGMSRRHKVGLHTHSNESRFDVEETGRRYGMRPIEALEQFGLLDAHRVLLAHCVWLDEARRRSRRCSRTASPSASAPTARRKTTISIFSRR